jgi:hypothetical protein
MINKKEQYDEDLLRNYINSEKIERAPEGFSSKTLTRIMIEAQSKEGLRSFIVRHRVPLISVLVTLGLIVAALFIPAKENDIVGSSILKFFYNVKSTLPSIRFIDIRVLNIPGWLIYAYLGALILAFLDWIFTGVFHKQR